MLGAFRMLDLKLDVRGADRIPRSGGAVLASNHISYLEFLKSGEVVGVFGEATISRSFMIKDLKNGAVRMAQAADVPLIPVVLWGTQRMWTKGRPRRLWQRHLPITVLVGEPLYPKKGQDSNELTAELRARLSALLEEAQSSYPDKPAGSEESWWLPAHLGGTAPTLEEAAAMDARGKADKAE